MSYIEFFESSPIDHRLLYNDVSLRLKKVHIDINMTESTHLLWDWISKIRIVKTKAE